MSWETLGNQNSLFKVTTDGLHIIVPVLRSKVEVIGYAYVDVSDLAPRFKTVKEAQAWVDSHFPTQQNPKEVK